MFARVRCVCVSLSLSLCVCVSVCVRVCVCSGRYVHKILEKLGIDSADSMGTLAPSDQGKARAEAFAHLITECVIVTSAAVAVAT